jgi:tetratricopeptide (TPR) repeat protein
VLNKKIKKSFFFFFWFQPLNRLRESCHGTQYSNKRIVSTKYEWKYYGKVHEYIAASPQIDAKYGTQCGTLPPSIYSLHDSEFGRAFERDAELLESAIEEDPEDTRARFYLANTYRALDKREDAIIQWAARIALGGWPEEVYMSALGIAMMMEKIVGEESDEKRALRDDTWKVLIEINMADAEGAPSGAADIVGPLKGEKETMIHNRKVKLSDIVTAYSKAHTILPYRQEAPFYLARISRLLLDDYQSSCYFAEAAVEAGPYSDSTLFADRDIYRFQIPDEICTCGYHVPGKESIGQKKCEELVEALIEDGAREKGAPRWAKNMLKRVENNLKVYTTSDSSGKEKKITGAAYSGD